MENTRHYSFYQHRGCEYFPCHRGIPEDAFNCLFCYCPLYALGERCGGSCRYTASGVKDCSGCTFPHQRENYDRVIERCGEILAMARQTEKPIDEAARKPYNDGDK
ncbi:MAG: cysteine-rich small domain-containing protein [Aristaeellaceae bacterium]